MEEKLEIVVLGLFAGWLVLLPMTFVAKIKYLKIVRGGQYNGTSDWFSFLSEEWWHAGLTLGLPILDVKGNVNTDTIRRCANRRLFWFYSVVLLQIILTAILYFA